MIDINQMIRTSVTSMIANEDKYFLAPNIPEKKLNNALKSISPNGKPEYVIAIIDTTIFNTCREGLVFYGDSFSYNTLLHSQETIQYHEIENVHLKNEITTNRKGKEVVKPKFTIHAAGKKYTLPELLLAEINTKKLESFLQEIIVINKKAIEDIDEDIYVKENQLLPLEMMEEEVKVDYVKALANFLLSEKDEIDAIENAELISFMVKINLNAEKRLNIRKYLYEGAPEPITDIFKRLEDETSSTEFEVIKQSLVKDILSMYKINSAVEQWRTNTTINRILESINISHDEVEVIIESLKKTEDIINQRLDDTEITKQMKDISAKALAVGVPMTALYFTGMTGVSAAGITSGLAGMGFKIFGLSKMFTGIGTIALIGAGAYQGAKHFTGLKDIENNKQREVLIQQIIRNQQATLNSIIEDINHISTELIEALKIGEENKQKAIQVAHLLSKYTNSAKTVSRNMNHLEIEEIISKLPKTIDHGRLDELTKDATLKDSKEFIQICYSINGNELNDGITKQEMQQLLEIMESLGYLNIKDASIATVKSNAKKAASNLEDYLRKKVTDDIN